MKKIIQKLIFIAEIVFIIGVKTLFSACGIKDDGTYMHCHQVENYVFLLGIVQLILQGAILLNRKVNKKVTVIISGMIVLVSAIMIMLPNYILPMCMMESMRCQSVMRPFIVSLNSGIILLTIFGEIAEYIEVSRTRSVIRQ